MLRAAAFLLLLIPASARAAEDFYDSTFVPEENCGICHGADGNSVTQRFPRLAGQDPAYLLKELRDFRARRRTNDEAAMTTAVEQLSDDDLTQAAAYFARQEPAADVTAKGGGGTAKRADAAQDGNATGARLFRDGRDGVLACASCHGSANAPYLAPRLGGQHAGYVEKQLQDFQTGKRANDPDGVMRAIAARLNAGDVAAVARYVSVLPAGGGSE